MRFIALSIFAFALATSPVHAAEPAPAEDESITLHLFGYAFPFLFKDKDVQQSFKWSEITNAGKIGIGILYEGGRSVGEVVGLDGVFWAAGSHAPTPTPVKPDETTVFGLVTDLEPARTTTLPATASKDDLAEALDGLFVDTDTYVYVAEVTAKFSTLVYDLQGANATPSFVALVKKGESEHAEDEHAFDEKTVDDVEATIVAVRAPTTLYSMFEVPYHMHFISADRAVLGHLNDVSFEAATVRWARVDRLDWRFWPKK